MTAVVFEGLTFSVYGVKILEDMHFKVRGIYNLIIAQDDFVDNCIRFYLSHRHIHGLSVEGDIIIDGAVVPAYRLNLLTNQFRLFHSHESVHDALHFVDDVRASQVLRHFDASFSSTPIGVLSMEESRIFEVLLSMVANPPFIFIGSLEISSSTRNLCLRLLRKYSASSAVLVVSEYDDAFDGTILIIDDGIHHLNKRDSQRLRTVEFLSKLQLDGCRLMASPSGDEEDAPYRRRRKALHIFLEKRRKVRDFEARCGGAPSKHANDRASRRIRSQARSQARPNYDYKALYRKYKCENLLDLENNTHSLSERFLVYDIYRINLSQSIKIALRKYVLMIGDNERNTNLYRNLNPFIVLICILRIAQEAQLQAITMDAPGLLCFVVERIFAFPHWSLQAGVFLFFKYIIRQPTPFRVWHIVHNIFRRDCSHAEFQCISALVYLAIFYSNAAIFEEECGFIQFYTNRIMTPATYLLSNCIYLGITHMSVFCILGLIFRIKCIASNVVNAISLNMFFACASTKRLRESAISIFLALYLSSLVISFTETQSYYFWLLSSILFPPILWKEHFFNESGHCLSMLYVLLFHIIVFICCCHRISRFGHIS